MAHPQRFEDNAGAITPEPGSYAVAAAGGAPHHQPIPVVLDLMDTVRAARGPCPIPWRTGQGSWAALGVAELGSKATLTPASGAAVRGRPAQPPLCGYGPQPLTGTLLPFTRVDGAS
jgi:hypothetical protein